MAQVTAFGKEVKKRLIDIDKSQTWLAEKIREKTGLYVDCGYLNKIFTNKRTPERIVSAIREILDLQEDSA